MKRALRHKLWEALVSVLPVAAVVLVTVVPKGKGTFFSDFL